MHIRCGIWIIQRPHAPAGGAWLVGIQSAPETHYLRGSLNLISALRLDLPERPDAAAASIPIEVYVPFGGVGGERGFFVGGRNWK